MANHCIAIGPGAEANDCDHQFVLRVNDTTYETIMTPEESEVMHRVIRRAVANSKGPQEPVGNQVSISAS